jgi:hypothetical protein
VLSCVQLTRRDDPQASRFGVRGARDRSDVSLPYARGRDTAAALTAGQRSDDEDLARLESIARLRTEPMCRVERARMLLAYRADPSARQSG